MVLVTIEYPPLPPNSILPMVPPAPIITTYDATTLAHFPVRASSGAVAFGFLTSGPGNACLESGWGHEHETENRDWLWAGCCDRNGVVSTVGYVVYSGGCQGPANTVWMAFRTVELP